MRQVGVFENHVNHLTPADFLYTPQAPQRIGGFTIRRGFIETPASGLHVVFDNHEPASSLAQPYNIKNHRIGSRVFLWQLKFFDFYALCLFIAAWISSNVALDGNMSSK